MADYYNVLVAVGHTHDKAVALERAAKYGNKCIQRWLAGCRHHLFMEDARDGTMLAVPRDDGTFTAWAGPRIRHIDLAIREKMGNALITTGTLVEGASIPGTNAVLIMKRKSEKKS